MNTLNFWKNEKEQNKSQFWFHEQIFIGALQNNLMSILQPYYKEI